MSAVTINTKQVSITAFRKNSTLLAGYNGNFRIESTEPSIPIEIGDDILFIKVVKDDMIFTNTGIVSSVGKREFVQGQPSTPGRRRQFRDRDKYHHHFNFEIKKILQKNNKLSELEYSLPIVDNYHHPEVHFQAQYRSLPEKDFETIVHGWVYATRTVFGKLVNALPRQNKLEFMIHAMDHFSTIDFSNISLIDGLDFLYQYIERRILSRGRLLVATDGIIKKELSDILPTEEVGFAGPENEYVHNISNQAQIFRSLFALEKEKSLKTTVKETVENNKELEARFQNLFSRRSWPVNLEK